MPVIRRPENSNLNQVSPTRIQQINEAGKIDESVNNQSEDVTSSVIKSSVTGTSISQSAATVSDKPVKQKEEQINFKLPQGVKTKWKKFFVENNINITQGIIFAVENLIQEVTDGEATLTMGGVYKKK